MLKKTCGLILMAASLTGGSLLYSQAVYVPLQHWVYPFLDRMEIEGVIPRLYQTRPCSRQRIADALMQIQSRLDEDPSLLSKAETDWFTQLKGEFVRELKSADIPVESRYHERHLLTWREQNKWIAADLYFREQIDWKRGALVVKDQSLSHTTGGGYLRGSLSDRAGFFLFVKNTMIKGEEITEEQFDPVNGQPIVTSGKNAYSDDASVYFTYHLPWLHLMFGRDQVQWGPGRRGQLMLSDQDAYFDMIRMQMQFKRFQFSAIHGKLNYGSAKFLAAHRLELNLFPWLSIAGSELVIYGDRSIEPMYLNPLMPYHVAEHHLGDLDNNTMGFDMTLHPLRNHRLFFELFLDDFTTAENPFKYYGNKWATQTGWRWLNPFGVRGADLQLEYTRIEPYVYTHRYPVNVYKNYDRPIGHWLGPDSDEFFFKVGYLYSRNLNISGTLQRIRHGEGDIDRPHQNADGTTKQLLSGIVETDRVVGGQVAWQFMRDGFLRLAYRHHSMKNRMNQAGMHAGHHQIMMDVEVNY